MLKITAARQHKFNIIYIIYKNILILLYINAIYVIYYNNIYNNLLTYNIEQITNGLFKYALQYNEQHYRHTIKLIYKFAIKKLMTNGTCKNSSTIGP